MLLQRFEYTGEKSVPIVHKLAAECKQTAEFEFQIVNK